MHCPNCQAVLRAMQYEGVQIHTCDGCGGEFVGPNELAMIVRTREQVFGEHLRELYADHDPVPGIPETEAQRDLVCPACNGSMRLINYANDTGVCIDRCDGCGGMWLDQHELQKIQVICEAWDDRAAKTLHNISHKLEAARRDAAASSQAQFAGSRFSFVNALLNRLLDTAA